MNEYESAYESGAGHRAQLVDKTWRNASHGACVAKVSSPCPEDAGCATCGRLAAEQLTCALVNTAGSDRVAQVRRLLDVLEEEMRDPLIVGVDEWDMERAEAPVIATGCKY